MDCRRTVITGGVLRSPPPASPAPLTIAAKTGVMRHRSRRHSRLHDNYCSDDDRDEYNNNNNNVSATSAPNITNTTLLVDELEQLRIDNFQLRLRVYNAERRVDRLSEAALGRNRKKRRNSSDTDSDDTDDSCDRGGSGAVHNTATAKATADAAVRTIHDLLTVNRRLLALLAATVSAKAVAVSADDKRRWRQLQNHIKEYVTDGPVKILTLQRILYCILLLVFYYNIFSIHIYIYRMTRKYDKPKKTKTTANYMTPLHRTLRHRAEHG